jgi:hypothetical protein
MHIKWFSEREGRKERKKEIVGKERESEAR